MGPQDLDLEMLLRQILLLQSDLGLSTLRKLANGDFADPDSRDRLIGYAVLRDVWGLLLWIRFADSYGTERRWPPEHMQDWDPWLRLKEHVEGRSIRSSFGPEICTHAFNNARLVTFLR